MVRLDPLESAAVASGEDFRLLRDWVHALFRHRRKQIGGLLRQLLGADAAAEALARGGWSERLRAENLALDDFLLLAREFPLKTL